MSDGQKRLDEAAVEGDLPLWVEFWMFLKENRKWWMIPILVVFGLVSLLAMAASSGASPFIYTLF